MSSKYDTVTLIELVESRPCLWEKQVRNSMTGSWKASFGLKCVPSWSQTSYNWTERSKWKPVSTTN